MVSIIILSYNTKNYLLSCLDALFQHTRDVVFEVIIVDNASSDDSVAVVKKMYGEKITLIENPANVGFAKGNNIGAKKAQYPYVLFLNSDTVFQDNAVKKMVMFLEQDKDVGIVGGKLVNSDGTMQRAYGTFYSLPSVFFMLVAGDRGEIALSSQQEKRSVDWVSGACMMVRKSLFDELKGFDEAFFMYIEDMELCYRVKNRGKSVYFLSSITIRHIGQGSSNRAFAIVHIYKGLLYFYKKHKSLWEYIIVRSMLTIKAIVLILIGTIMNNMYLRTTYRKALQF